jgi:hypothetical protein
MKTLIKILFHLLTPERLSAKCRNCGVIRLKTDMLPSPDGYFCNQEEADAYKELHDYETF